jgi:hypothetical protein
MFTYTKGADEMATILTKEQVYNDITALIVENFGSVEAFVDIWNEAVDREDHDGQPDEHTEWMDFDPEC